VIDELGYVPFSKTGAELLFQFCSARHERAAWLSQLISNFQSGRRCC